MLNCTKADKLVFIHSNIRLQVRFSESYKHGPYRKWNINPNRTDLEDSTMKLIDMTWSLLEEDGFEFDKAHE